MIEIDSFFRNVNDLNSADVRFFQTQIERTFAKDREFCRIMDIVLEKFLEKMLQI